MAKVQLGLKITHEFHGEYFVNSLSFIDLWFVLSCCYSSYWGFLFYWKITLHFWISCKSQIKIFGNSFHYDDPIFPSSIYNCKPSNVSHLRKQKRIQRFFSLLLTTNHLKPMNIIYANILTLKFI